MDNGQLPKKLGEKLRNLRQLRGYTQEDMADFLQTSTATYAKIERGETDINLSRLEELAKIFGVSANELLKLADASNVFLNCSATNGSSVCHQGNVIHSSDISQMTKAFEDINKFMENLVLRLEKLEKKQ
jgi:transcriptional regulator with XRE-family HTH domain